MCMSVMQVPSPSHVKYYRRRSLQIEHKMRMHITTILNIYNESNDKGSGGAGR